MEQQRIALLALGGVAGAVFALSRLQVTHLLALLIATMWAAASYAYYVRAWPMMGGASAASSGTPTAISAENQMRFLAMNNVFLDVLRDIAPLKRFDRARFEELGKELDAFQKRYVYQMSGRTPIDVEGLKEARMAVQRVAYSLYLVVPKVGQHFYGDSTLWSVLDAAFKTLQDTLETMCTVVVNHAELQNVPVPNLVGAEPANRGQ